MNIEEYRALVAKEKEDEERIQKEEAPVEQPTQKKEEVKAEVEETKPEEEVTKEEDRESNVYEIDGEEVTIDELTKGYLRQSDYTKKTQKLAREKEEISEALSFYNEVKNNPKAIDSLRENVSIPRKADPTQKQMIELEEELYDMKLDNEINLMESKYDDFDVQEVLKFATEKKMTNLEDAYLLNKSKKGTSTKEDKVKDIDTLRDEIKSEIMAEIKGSNTSSIISSKKSSRVDDKKEVKLTSGEVRVAENMGLSKEEYAKWRDADKA